MYPFYILGHIVKLVFTIAGELYLFNIKEGRSRKIKIKLDSKFTAKNYEFNTVAENIERIHLFDEENVSIVSRGRGILKGKYMNAPVTLNSTFHGRIRNIDRLDGERFAVPSLSVTKYNFDPITTGEWIFVSISSSFSNFLLSLNLNQTLPLVPPL